MSTLIGEKAKPDVSTCLLVACEVARPAWPEWLEGDSSIGCKCPVVMFSIYKVSA